MPVRNDARLGEHIEVAVHALVNDRPLRRSSASPGVRASSQPGSSGQCIGARCWSVISSTRLGRRGSAGDGGVASLLAVVMAGNLSRCSARRPIFSAVGTCLRPTRHRGHCRAVSEPNRRLMSDTRSAAPASAQTVRAVSWRSARHTEQKAPARRWRALASSSDRRGRCHTASTGARSWTSAAAMSRSLSSRPPASTRAPRPLRSAPPPERSAAR